MPANNKSVSITWKALVTLSQAPNLTVAGPDFNVISNPRLFTQFSIPTYYGYVPLKLSPTVSYFEVLRNKLRQDYPDIPVVGRKFPLKLNIKNKRREFGNATLNINIRLFLPNILSMTVALYDFEHAGSIQSASDLIQLQELNNLIPLNEIIRWTVAVAGSLDHRKLAPATNPSSKPAIHLSNMETADGEAFEQLVEFKLQEFVGILIRNSTFSLMGDRIPNEIWKKNIDINVKSTKEVLLIDKQGILFLTAIDEKSDKAHESRISKTHDLFEIALVYQRFLDKFFEIRSGYEEFSYFILNKMQHWFKFPQTVFSQSVTNQNYWKLLMKELHVEDNFMRVMSDDNVRQVLEIKGKDYNKIGDGWWDRKDFPSALPEILANNP